MAKTYTNLYTKITDFENIFWAWRTARRGKRYKPAAAAFEFKIDEELLHPAYRWSDHRRQAKKDICRINGQDLSCPYQPV